MNVNEDKGVVFLATMIARSGLNPHPGHLVVSLHKKLYDDYLCLVALINHVLINHAAAYGGKQLALSPIWPVQI